MWEFSPSVPKEGTPAYDMIDQVKEKTAVERRDKADEERQMEMSESLLKKRIGQKLLVLLEDFCEDGYIGRSQHQAADIDGTGDNQKQRGNLSPENFTTLRSNRARNTT